MGNAMFRRRCRPRDWFRCTSEPHPRQGDSPSHPRCDSPGLVSPPLRLLVALTVQPDTGRGEQSSYPRCDLLRFARRGGRLAPSPGKAITGPGSGHHGPFGKIDVLNSPNGPWCLSPATVFSRLARRQPGRSAHDAQGEPRGAPALDEPGDLMPVDVTARPQPAARDPPGA